MSMRIFNFSSAAEKALAAAEESFTSQIGG